MPGSSDVLLVAGSCVFTASSLVAASPVVSSHDVAGTAVLKEGGKQPLDEAADCTLLLIIYPLHLPVKLNIVGFILAYMVHDLCSRYCILILTTPLLAGSRSEIDDTLAGIGRNKSWRGIPYHADIQDGAHGGENGMVVAQADPGFSESNIQKISPLQQMRGGSLQNLDLSWQLEYTAAQQPAELEGVYLFT